MYESKCLECYFDSRTYSSEQVQENIDEIKRQFPNKQIKVSLALNDFGVYVITFKFEHKNNYWNKIKIKLKSKRDRRIFLDEKDRIKRYTEPKIYGQYKQTGIYKPY